LTRIFLVGAGTIARQHALAAADPAVVAESSELHVCDLSDEALRGFIDDVPHAIAHGSLASMLSSAPRPDDVVVIATPPDTHYRVSVEALETGRHVLCEKPLTLRAEHARDLAARANSLGLAVGSCESRFRFVPATQRVRELIRSGSLGRPYHLSFVNRRRRSRSGFDYQTSSAWFRRPASSGAGVLMDWGPYDIAVLDELLSPVAVEICTAWSATPDDDGTYAEESASADHHAGAAMRAELPDGTTVHVTYERAAHTHGASRSVVEVEGTSAAASWDWLDWEGEHRVEVATDHERGRVVDTYHPGAHPITFHSRPLQEFLAIVTSGSVDAFTALTERALFAQRWLNAVIDATETGRPQRIVRAEP
jgi:predicted dehydrogenase